MEKEENDETEEREGSEQNLRAPEDAGKADAMVDPDEPENTGRQVEENASQKEEKESSSVSAHQTKSSGEAECSEPEECPRDDDASDHECSDKGCCGDACSGQKQRSDAPGEPAKVVRDRPNTRHVRVNLRDGLICQNPCCGRRLWLFSHHIEFRSKGGRTLPGNECLVCGWCHKGSTVTVQKGSTPGNRRQSTSDLRSAVPPVPG